MGCFRACWRNLSAASKGEAFAVRNRDKTMRIQQMLRPNKEGELNMNKPKRALSIRQPYAEMILLGKKKIETRTRLTNIRERVYIYASKTPGDEDAFRKMKMKPGDLPVGVLVGTVEITGCTEGQGVYEWHLSKPERLPKPLKPENRPQPVWFHPF
jgi:hypothetical protein